MAKKGERNLLAASFWSPAPCPNLTTDSALLSRRIQTLAYKDGESPIFPFPES